MKLCVNNLSFSYDHHEVLRDISFSVEAGEFLSVLGPNGVGKSTLFRCILGLLTGYGGDILVDGENIRTLSRKALAGRIAYIPQIHRPTFGYTVLDTVLMGTTHQLSPFVQPKTEHTERAVAALERLKMEHLASRNFANLSGGEQQLVLVARAIAQQADILVMDEPTSALDFGNQLHVLEQIRRLSEEGYTVLMSTHNPQHALSFTGRILALADGCVVANGETEETLNAQLIRKLYGVTVSMEKTRHGSMIFPQRRWIDNDVPVAVRYG